MLKLKKISLVFLLLILFFLPVFILTQNANGQESPDRENVEDILQSAGQGANYETNVSENTLPSLIGKIISIVLGFVGSIFFILIIVSGFQWMTSGGNEEKVKSAKQRIINATIGLGITVTAYFITYLVTNLMV